MKNGKEGNSNEIIIRYLVRWKHNDGELNKYWFWFFECFGSGYWHFKAVFSGYSFGFSITKMTIKNYLKEKKNSQLYF